jgi:folate-binding protein YgfZ
MARSSAEHPGVADDLGRGFAALRGSAAISHLADRAILAVRGEDRASFLQGMLSNEVAKLSPGQGAYALLLTEQGKVVADLRAYVCATEIRLCVPRQAGSDVRTALERFVVADDVEFGELVWWSRALRGPQAASVLGRLGDAGRQAAALPECGHVETSLDGVDVWVARVRDVGVDGFHLRVTEPGGEIELERRLVECGAVPAPDAAVEEQRIAAGFAKPFVDYDAQTLAPEIPSLARAISYTKGCYLGQEVVERVAARGHVNRLLVGLVSSDGGTCGAGSTVSLEGRDVGRVTSAARRPDTNDLVALALVRRAAAEAGTLVTVAGEDGAALGARVVQIPLADSAAEQY